MSDQETNPMATMNISLPGEMKAFIEQQAARGGFGTVSENMRDLIRELMDRQAERDRIDGLLLAGLDSDDPGRLGIHPALSPQSVPGRRGNDSWLGSSQRLIGIPEPSSILWRFPTPAINRAGGISMEV
jgi:antitoxin ParD1/3/4